MRVYLMNVAQTKSTDLLCESACSLLSSVPTIAICYCCPVNQIRHIKICL